MRPFFALFTAASAALVVLMLTAPTFAQTAPPVSAEANASAAGPLILLAPADVQTLADALRSVSRQAGNVAFIAEGKPFRARNSAPPLLPLVAKWPVKGLPLQEAVVQIAHAYDYEAERKADVFLLRKRYTNPDDLPDVTAEELRLSLRDAVRASSGLPAPTVSLRTYEEKNTPFAAKFYQTLTPAQIKSMVKVDNFFHTLPVSDLTPAQKQMMRDLVVSRHVQNAVNEPQKAYAALRACDQKTTAFGWADLIATHPNSKKTQTVRILCCMVREKGQSVLVPFAPDGRMRFRFDNRKIGYRGPGDGPDDDGSAPQPSDYGPSHEPLPPPQETGPDTFTLQSLADALKKREPTTGQQIKPRGFLPQNELAAKHVTVVGINEVNAEWVWRAAGDLYGLHPVRTEQNGPLRLQRPRPQVASDLAGLNAAVFAAFPAPLIRLYRGVFSAAEAQQLAHPKYGPFEPNDSQSESVKSNLARTWAYIAHYHASRNTPNKLIGTVLHRFRILMEPHLMESNGYRVVYSDLNHEAHDLWTLALVIDCLENVSGLENKILPTTITDFDKGYLTSFINDGFGTANPQLDITFWGQNDHKAPVGHLYPLPDSVPKPAKPVK